MNFELLKLGFKAYLEGINRESNTSYNLNDSDISIFMYADEFKDYLTDELNIDVSIFADNIDNIMSLELIDGKLTNPNYDEDNTDAVQENNENNNQQKNQDLENSQIVTNLLNDLLQDETFKKTIDTDENGTIEKDELTDFFNSIKGLDENEETISLNDIISATKDMQDGTFEIITPETIKEDLQTEPSITKGPTSTVGSSGSTVSSGGGSRNTTSSNGSQTSIVQEKTLDNMTKEELKSELLSAQSDLSEKQNKLSSILDGSDEKLQSLNENKEKLYDTYQEELEKVDKDMAEQVDTLKQDIDSKQDEIDSKDQEIADQEGVVSESENAYNNAVSTRENLEASLSALQGVDTADMDSDKKSELSSKIAELQSKISDAKEAENNAKEAWDNAEEKLDTLNEERETLQGELDELEKQMTDLEAEIVEKYPQMKEYMDAYNEADEEYKEYKESATASAKAEIQEAQDYVNEINTAINNFDNKEVAKEYVLDGLTDLTRTAIELAYSQLGVYEDEGDNKGTMEKYGGGAGVPWCAAFVSWLYGKGQEGIESPLDFNASVSGLRSQAQEAGYYSEVGTYTPVPGDIMIQKSNGASHTGIVVGVDDKYIYTIEGNSGDAVRERKYEIGSSSYGKISGWIRMNEWSGGSSDIPRDTYLANNNSEDANEKERSTY